MAVRWRMLSPGVQKLLMSNSASHYIDSVEGLREACSGWQQLAFVALDTEFMRSDTYFAELGLIQLNVDSKLLLVDPLVPGMAEELAPIMTSPDVVKLLHSGSEDLQILHQYLGSKVGPIFDTQIAAAFCGFGFSTSYRSLVEQICEVQLAKGQTRSDWLQRPLAAAQLNYAAEDVAYLPALFDELNTRLRGSDKLGWVEAECAGLAEEAISAVDPEQAYKRISRAWQLPAKNLFALQRLAQWREYTAIERNRPRNWVLKDRQLWSLAEKLPAQAAELSAVGELSAAQKRRYGETLLELIESVLNADTSAYPQAIAEPPGKSYAEIGKQLRALVLACADELQVAPEMLARKKDLEYLMQTHASSGSAQLPPSLNGWRQQLLGERLRERVNRYFEQQVIGNGN